MLFTFAMFVILLSTVVLFHEAGHFLVGRYFGFGIEAFAIGFGKAIVKIERGGIEYRFNWIPFGGYVKFVGEMDEEEIPEEKRASAFGNQPAYQKAAVVFAGPLMNVVLAFFIFTIMFLVGFPTATTRIGYVAPDSAAAAAGIIPGDHIVEIEGESLWRWEDMSKMIEERPGIATSIVIERDDKRIPMTVTPTLADKRNIFNILEKKGVLGVGESSLRPIIGVPDASSPAGLAGLKTGLQIVAVDGKEIYFQDTLTRLLADKKPHKLSFVEDVLLDTKDWKPTTVSIVPDENAEGLAAYGLEFADLYVMEPPKDENGEKSKLQKHDKFLSVDGVEFKDGYELRQIIYDSPGKPLLFSIARAGKTVDMTLTPKHIIEKDIMGEKQEYGQIGFKLLLVNDPTELRDEQSFNPFTIVKRGAELSFFWAKVTVQAFGKIFTGEVSFKAAGGPLTIAVMAGEAARHGAFPFFLLMAIISLNLAVVNLVPIPVLDGGQMCFFLVEMVARRPISQRFREISMRVGIAILGVLIVFVLYMDFARYSLKILGFFEKVLPF